MLASEYVVIIYLFLFIKYNNCRKLLNSIIPMILMENSKMSKKEVCVRMRKCGFKPDMIRLPALLWFSPSPTCI